MNLPPKIIRQLGLQPQDRLAMRVVGPLIVMERIPLELLARAKDLPVPLYGGGGR